MRIEVRNMEEPPFFFKIKFLFNQAAELWCLYLKRFLYTALLIVLEIISAFFSFLNHGIGILISRVY